MDMLRNEEIMNKRLSRRLDKLEAKAELIQAESKAKKAKLLRLEQLEKENSPTLVTLVGIITSSKPLRANALLAMLLKLSGNVMPVRFMQP